MSNMDVGLDLLKQAMTAYQEQNSKPPKPESTWRWAVVTQVDPLRIAFDGEDELPDAPDSIVDTTALEVDDRVWCLQYGKRIIIHGKGGGIAFPTFPTLTPEATVATPSTLVLRDSASRAQIADPAAPADIDTMGARDAAIAEAIAELYGWERVVPSGFSSTGATATMDASGVVTCPAGTTAVSIDGILDPDYETEVLFQGAVISGAATGYSMRMRVVQSGTPVTGAGYQCGGAYSQFSGAHGWYGAAAATSAPVGAVATGPSPGAPFTTSIRLRRMFTSAGWFFSFHSMTTASAIGSWGDGYAPAPASGESDGLRFYPDGTDTPTFRGEFTVYRRRIT